MWLMVLVNSKRSGYPTTSVNNEGIRISAKVDNFRRDFSESFARLHEHDASDFDARVDSRGGLGQPTPTAGPRSQWAKGSGLQCRY